MPDPATLGRLRLAKLRALVTDRWGAPGDDVVVGSPSTGAALATGATGWFLVEADHRRGLGAALAWAHRAGVEDLHVLVAEDAEAAGILARRAACFRPAPSVWLAPGRDLTEAEPAPPSVEPGVGGDVDVYLDLFARSGVEPVVEDGVLRGEVLGLEVARVVADGPGHFLEVGVGKHDREAHKEAHGDQAAADRLPAVVAQVLEHRRPGALPHPANQLGIERWVRAEVVRRPSLVGARELRPVPSPVRRDDLRQAASAPAAGVDDDGTPVLVVCSNGIDLDLVPAAADARLAWEATGARGGRLALVVPEKDDHPITRALAARLDPPAEVRPIPWPVP